MMFCTMERYEEALVCYEHINVRETDSAEKKTILWNCRGISHFLKGAYDEATRCFSNVLNLDPECEEAKNYLKKAISMLNQQKKQASNY
ncbi:tetratricopeptide repeat protein [Methanohalophilus sp. RSK]|uniref:tetratricopeptide repeat protein n=1 Tax=Methanohalophilus sp. RSK TaxID=2485783 RepID=UPI000F43A1C3|nr:tetratricopeptide repeat protein [Methanohalophilus sp. RSK]RNI14467.1 tetratricopeptide repeat protein [Methanohalophilus sp. RSK]